MHLSLSFVMALFAVTVYASSVEQTQEMTPSKATKTWGTDLRGGAGSGFRQEHSLRGGAGGGIGISGGIPGFVQLCHDFSGFQTKCNTMVQAFQSSQVQFDVAIKQFGQFCDQFDSLTLRLTTISSFKEIQSSTYVSQFQKIFIDYTTFTHKLALIIQSRWGANFGFFSSVFQRYCIDYQRLFGVAVSVGINVSTVLSGLHLNLSIFSFIGLNLQGLIGLDGATLIHSHGVLGGGVVGLGGHVGGGVSGG
ncbi:hypothetical protein CROQUDRAFT_109111, partial [Cronartium quercuum f. sp. fusiforme G11]